MLLLFFCVTFSLHHLSPPGPLEIIQSVTLHKNYQRITIQESPGKGTAGRLSRWAVLRKKFHFKPCPQDPGPRMACCSGTSATTADLGMRSNSLEFAATSQSTLLILLIMLPFYLCSYSLATTRAWTPRMVSPSSPPSTSPTTWWVVWFLVFHFWSNLNCQVRNDEKTLRGAP